ncbi:MAG: class I mannose-6-phosphate isomerase [Planctomycetes bacterium]|nr:class I mannose-6-phosphate isomerase [Planctomycetota bacterium]MCB9884608.1 class I mannose-6-phosphate isomerase [Planctomycetota bacterium]
MSNSQPLLLERKLVPKVWGGQMLSQLLDIDVPAGTAIGETWELYDRPEGSSRLRGEQRTLAEVLREDPVALLGAGVAAGTNARFPLMLKFIDAREALSVQVHPDDDLARAENDRGKNEAWVVLHAGPRARICRGVRADVDVETFRGAADSAAVEQLLWAFTPQVGDCVHVPAGTVHAMGPDVVVFEVQQNSDVTYRLYDWGRDRDVHVQKALAAMRFVGGGQNRREVPTQLDDGGELLVTESHFRLRRYRVSDSLRLPTRGRFATVTVIGGNGDLVWPSSAGPQRLALQRGDTALVPAALAEVVVEAAAPMVMLVCDPGEK